MKFAVSRKAKTEAGVHSLDTSWPDIRQFIRACLKDKKDFVLPINLLKRKFQLNGNFVKNLQNLLNKEPDLYVVREYHCLRFYRMESP